MTYKRIASYSIALTIALLTSGGTTAFASEVVGTLSSTAATQPSVTGVIGGNVNSGATLSGSVSGGSSGGGGGGSSSGASHLAASDVNGSGEVLGAATTNLAAASPGFPNAGEEPETTVGDVLWGSIIAASTLGALAAMVLIEVWLRERIVR